MNRPEVVCAEVWQAALDALRIQEKRATRALDALAAERRRLPMVRFARRYRFEGADGIHDLADLFEGRRQLVLYHFMSPERHLCPGCCSFADNIPRLEHLHARDTTLALVTPAPYATLRRLQARMGWSVPFHASLDAAFQDDCGVGSGFGLSVFLRDGEDVFRTYFTSARGVGRLRMDFNLLDLTAYGRQEGWEDSPAGWPQTPPYAWWRLHDEYATDAAG